MEGAATGSEGNAAQIPFHLTRLLGRRWVRGERSRRGEREKGGGTLHDRGATWHGGDSQGG